MMIKHACILGPEIASRAAVLTSYTQFFEADDKTYWYVIGPRILSRAAVPASRTQVLENADVAYLLT